MCSLDSLLKLRHHPRVQLARRHLLDSVQHLDRQVTRAGPDLEDRVCVPQCRLDIITIKVNRIETFVTFSTRACMTRGFLRMCWPSAWLNCIACLFPPPALLFCFIFLLSFTMSCYLGSSVGGHSEIFNGKFRSILIFCYENKDFCLHSFILMQSREQSLYCNVCSHCLVIEKQMANTCTVFVPFTCREEEGGVRSQEGVPVTKINKWRCREWREPSLYWAACCSSTTTLTTTHTGRLYSWKQIYCKKSNTIIFSSF